MSECFCISFLVLMEIRCSLNCLHHTRYGSCASFMQIALGVVRNYRAETKDFWESVKKCKVKRYSIRICFLNNSSFTLFQSNLSANSNDFCECERCLHWHDWHANWQITEIEAFFGRLRMSCLPDILSCSIVNFRRYNTSPGKLRWKLGRLWNYF